MERVKGIESFIYLEKKIKWKRSFDYDTYVSNILVRHAWNICESAKYYQANDKPCP